MDLDFWKIWYPNETSKTAIWKITKWPVQQCLRHAFLSNVWFYTILQRYITLGQKCKVMTSLKPPRLKKPIFKLHQGRLRSVCYRYWKFETRLRRAVLNIWWGVKSGGVYAPPPASRGLRTLTPNWVTFIGMSNEHTTVYKVMSGSEPMMVN